MRFSLCLRAHLRKPFNINRSTRYVQYSSRERSTHTRTSHLVRRISCRIDLDVSFEVAVLFSKRTLTNEHWLRMKSRNFQAENFIFCGAHELQYDSSFWMNNKLLLMWYSSRGFLNLIWFFLSLVWWNTPEKQWINFGHSVDHMGVWIWIRSNSFFSTLNVFLVRK